MFTFSLKPWRQFPSLFEQRSSIICSRLRYLDLATLLIKSFFILKITTWKRPMIFLFNTFVVTANVSRRFPLNTFLFFWVAFSLPKTLKFKEIYPFAKLNAFEIVKFCGWRELQNLNLHENSIPSILLEKHWLFTLMLM